jgi:two-component system OmpR family response regulator
VQAPAADVTPRILLVEDDPEISHMLLELLSESGFAASAGRSGMEMDELLKEERFDLMLLDLMLPGEDGLNICRRLRASSDMPIIMVTARGEEVDRIVGLEIGADDYLPKPFNPRELVARIRALLRRSNKGPAGADARPRRLMFDGWIIDPAARQLCNPDGARVTLTSVEFDILLALCRHPAEVLSREQLIENVHGGAGPFERSVDVHVSRIRQKLETDPRDPMLIKTVRLGGYVFTAPVEEA